MGNAKKTGRTPIICKKEKLERQPMLMLVLGETGVGKTYRNILEIKRYMLDNPQTGKKGRKVIAFDTNDDDYTEFRTLNPNYIKALTAVSCRRIRPFNPDGTPMDNDQKKEVVDKILKHFKNGMIVLDDIDNYMANARGQSMIGALCTIRHKGVDVLLTHQSIGKVTTSEWQNCTWLRLHKQVDEATVYKKRIPKYKMVRIAQLIVEEQYDLAALAFMEGKMSKKESEIKMSFFVYIDMRKGKISGCSRAAFIRACKRFIDQEEGRKVRMLMQEQDFKGRLKYKNRNAAIIKMISDYILYHDNRFIEL